jgi:hypothetical protein
MQTNSLRAKMYFRRKLFQKLQFKPFNSISIHDREKPSDISKEFLANYSQSSTHEEIDFRNGHKRGHYFAERNVYLVKNVILEPRQGILYSEFGKLITESTTWNPLHQYFSFPWNFKKFSRLLEIEEAIVLSSNPYGHWLLEDLPTTIASMNLKPNAPILVSRNHPKYVKDFLATTNRKIHFLDGPTKISSVILVEKSSDSGWLPKADLDTLHNYPPFSAAMKSNSGKRLKIYATRKGLKRSPINEDHIEKLFLKFGFEVYDLARLDLLKEISLLADTEILSGLHGSSFANIIWMKENSMNLEIVNRNYWTEYDLNTKYLGLNLRREKYTYSGEPSGAVPLEELELKLRFLFPN